MKKAGEEFEDLVEVISKQLHKKAIVTKNDKIKDIHTGKNRQIDISIRINDGPTKFLAIIEARDRSRKVGVPYLEQVKTKRDSVGADKAIIVSNKGFTQTAIEKSKYYNIELFSLIDAIRNNWSSEFILFQGIVEHSIAGDYQLAFYGPDGYIIKVHQSLIEQLKNHNLNAMFFLYEKGHPVSNLRPLINIVVNNNSVKSLVASDTSIKHPVNVAISMPPDLKLYIQNETGNICRLGYCLVTGTVWKQIKAFPPTLKQYEDAQTGELYAEVIGSDDPDCRYELIYENASRQLSVRIKGPKNEIGSHGFLIYKENTITKQEHESS